MNILKFRQVKYLIVSWFVSILAIGSAFAQDISVGLYPWVPRVEQFQTELTKIWKQRYPDDNLIFVSKEVWDGGYNTNPSDQLDVYVFDAINMNYFAHNGWLLPLVKSDIDDFDDFFDYAVDGIKMVGTELYWGIPQVGCARLLFYQANDTEVHIAQTLTQLKTTLNSCQYTGQVPPNKTGLMVDMSGSTTNASLYLQAVYSIYNQMPMNLPFNSAEFDADATANLRSIMEMSSYDNSTKETASYQHGEWFEKGHGRAFVGFTESMAVMSSGTLDNIEFKVMPLSNNTESNSLFYADIVGVYPKQNRTDKELSKVKELANVMASKDYMVSSSKPIPGALQGPESNPQYLMPLRKSIFVTLGREYPIYNKMKMLVENSSPVLFIMNEQSRTWIRETKENLQSAIRKDFACEISP
ncbi:thiamine pyridinylase [Xenorhabdus japonica]|uniref:Carbohydrate ABC transporter substrate-binding protein, CUT1 family n=1 Tax=Xenorhabdus japonica TaxID=53341 RepID=A0A1I5CWU3_9GAMM|nr:thiamine pyridinylase [Xenorhabdus japonica]SFN91434.1 carbohydrate ABC transporter substrate-binding protein, CUT1 family [Xenorhabdus japonica]